MCTVVACLALAKKAYLDHTLTNNKAVTIRELARFLAVIF